MTPRQFIWHLGLHGADFSVWPDEAAARAILGRSARARTALADVLAADAEPAPAAPGVLRGWRGRAPTALRTGLRWSSFAVATAAGLWLATAASPTAPDAFAIVQAGAMP